MTRIPIGQANLNGAWSKTLFVCVTLVAPTHLWNRQPMNLWAGIPFIPRLGAGLGSTIFVRIAPFFLWGVRRFKCNIQNIYLHV